jgi:hypothetical protein
MRASGTFKVVAFTPTSITPHPAVNAGRPVGVSSMEKRYRGEIAGRSATLFTATSDQAAGAGPYAAMESFEGTVDGRDGTFDFAHAATSGGAGRSGELFTIMPSSGTGRLAGIHGSGGMAIDADGTHHVWFDYELG